MSNQTNNKLSNMVADERLAELAVEDDLYNYPLTQAELNSISAELQEYRKAAEIPVWTDCNKQTPKEGGRYWCYVEEINSLGKSQYQWNCSWNGDEWSDAALSGRVTHWMPLAAAPQPSSNPLQLGSTTEAAPVLDSTPEITMPSSTTNGGGHG